MHVLGMAVLQAVLDLSRLALSRKHGMGPISCADDGRNGIGTARRANPCLHCPAWLFAAASPGDTARGASLSSAGVRFRTTHRDPPSDPLPSHGRGIGRDELTPKQTTWESPAEGRD